MNDPGVCAVSDPAAAASSADWDVVVIGAGPAGALAAYLLAGRSLRTLLVERCVWPRAKVCGGCLNGRALHMLERVGLDGVCRDLDAGVITRLRIWCGAARAELPLANTMAVARREFDAVLVERAVAAGATFLADCKATVVPQGGSEVAAARRHVTLGRRGHPARQVSTKVVLVADGLGHPSLDRLPEFNVRIEPNARIGLGATLAAEPWSGDRDTITMAVGRWGYVGAVWTASGVNVAAAVDRQVLKSRGAEPAVSEILHQAGGSLTLSSNLSWTGTRPLGTRSPRIAGNRLFLLGDAVGYVEPFTGEGMAWALESAWAVAPLAALACRHWDDALAQRWERDWGHRFWRSQRWCRLVAAVARRPALGRCLVSVLGGCPWLATPAVRRISLKPQFFSITEAAETTQELSSQ